MSTDLSFKVTAPSNIAFIKYWGKAEGQIPKNPSLSMTLKNSCTTMDVQVLPDQSDFKLLYTYQGQSNPKFSGRMEKLLATLHSELSWLGSTHLKIDATNSFPHSAGIASSASAFAALGAVIELVNVKLNDGEFDSSRASHFARMGSGSAARSLTGNYNLWGECDYPHSSDQYAVSFNRFHKNFEQVCDSICIVDPGPKPISSSQGHALMQDHPYAEARFEQARENLYEICHAMELGDWKLFGSVLEREALSLVALMMTSPTPFILIKPTSLMIVEKVWQFRQQTGLDLYFTVDAGPNVHLIYPQSQREEIWGWIQAEIAPLCHQSMIIDDQIGEGVFVEYC